MFLKNASIAIVLLLIGFLTACNRESSEKPQPENTSIYTVEPTLFESDLFFSGTIQPLQVVNITSPFEGALTQKYFEYGQEVQQGEPLATLLSQKFSEEYQTALTHYLESKDHHRNKKAEFAGKEMLWKAGILADTEYQQNKSALASSALKQLQAETRLNTLLQQAAKVDPSFTYIDVKDFDLFDTETVLKELSKEVSEITFFAPTSGIALYPMSSSSGNSSSASKEIHIGSEIKTGQVIVAIGDLSGVSLVVEVNEVNLRHVQIGQPVIITGPAFPDIELQGKIVSIDSQARSKSSGLPTFPMRIEVSELTAEHRKQVHVGMSAKVRVLKQQADTLSIPIQAVFREGETDLVHRRDPVTGEFKKVPVITGTTTLDKVEIKKGLQPGDQVLLHD